MAPPEEYAVLVGRDSVETERLNLQHRVLASVCNFLIHPSIPTTFPSLKVADVGTGTGIWLFDVAELLPSTCTLNGFDISSEQFPPKESWPSNLTLSTHDILAPFPASELGTYDLVAVKFLAFVLVGEQWENAVQNLITLLKPGGYLQWIDGDMAENSVRVLQTEPGASRAACLETNEAWMALARKTGRVGNESLTLKTSFKGLGLEEVREDAFATDRLPEFRAGFTMTTYQAVKRFLWKMEAVGIEGWPKERADRVGRELDVELESGKVYLSVVLVCVVGRKPVVDSK